MYLYRSVNLWFDLCKIATETFLLEMIPIPPSTTCQQYRKIHVDKLSGVDLHKLKMVTRDIIRSHGLHNYAIKYSCIVIKASNIAVFMLYATHRLVLPGIKRKLVQTVAVAGICVPHIIQKLSA